MKKNLLFLFGLLLPTLLTAQIKVGDIMCVQGNDTLMVRPEDYTSGGIGVVFYIDESGKHGWVLHREVQAGYIYWSSICELPWGLTGWQSIRDAIYDLDGYDNTSFIRAASEYDHSLYPCAWAVDYEHGWYWPALGQLNILFGVLPKVNQSLEVMGGEVSHGGWSYWSSSAYGFDNDCALYAGYTGAMGAIVKSRTSMGETNVLYVRSIRDF